MTAQEIKEVFIKQMALDGCCTVEDIKSGKPVLRKKTYEKGRRIFRGDDCFLKVLIVSGQLIVNCESEAFLEENRQFFLEANPAWLFSPDTIRELDNRVRQYGHVTTNCHHYYLPLGKPLPVEQIGNGNMHWYEQKDIEQFRGDHRFPEALTFYDHCPDMLAVTWEEDGEILGMAGTSADSDTMWQIGINILPKGKHKGLGVFLVTALKEEILKRGKVPFYGTAESHILSQRVGVSSGFLPAWAELYTRRL